jgi:drug/metabolite transporter (DMT)-like permease
MITPFSSIVLVFIASVIGSLAAVLLKCGANRLQKPYFRALIWLGGGILLFCVSSVFYVWGLKDGSLTVLYPMASLGYVCSLLWSKLFFGEPFNRHKVLGLALVLVGVFFIGLGNQ